MKSENVTFFLFTKTKNSHERINQQRFLLRHELSSPYKTNICICNIISKKKTLTSLFCVPLNTFLNCLSH